MIKPKQPKVSVVVPIYNVERYLRECVDSILAQTLKEIEVILIDDGSPDNCGKIIDDYAASDKRVVAVHQKNSGYSTAVNKGIDLARGEYVGIIESDDWIEPDMYEKLYASASKNKTDITKGLFYIYNSTLPKKSQNELYTNPCGVDLRKAPNKVFKAEDFEEIIGFHASIWSSIYRADFIKKIKIPDTAGASYQDFPFMIEAMVKANRITVVKEPFVHWRNDPSQGNSTSANGKKLLLMAKNTLTGLKIIKKSGKLPALREAFYAQALWANIGFFYRIDRKYKDEYYKILRQIFSNLNNDSTFTYKFFRPEDKLAVKSILKHPNWQQFWFSHILGGLRRLPHRAFNKALRLYRKYEEIVNYLIAGALSTIVSIASYALISRVFGQDIIVSNVISWIITVTFVYITNRIYVFKSKSIGLNMIKEIISFAGARIFTLVLETVIIWLFADIIKIDDVIGKTIAQVVVIITNYILSKLFVFKKR